MANRGAEPRGAIWIWSRRGDGGQDVQADDQADRESAKSGVTRCLASEAGLQSSVGRGRPDLCEALENHVRVVVDRGADRGEVADVRRPPPRPRPVALALVPRELL